MSLQPIDGTLPDTLGNHFAVVLFSMPLGIEDPAALIAEVHERTTRLKNSAEPIVAFGVQKVIAEAPKKVARGITDFFSRKTIGQLSNVPGPRTQLRFAGIPVDSVCAFVPTSGDQPLGICVFSYNGSVAVGVSGDRRMVPDPDHISQGVGRHVGALLAAATAHRTATSSTTHQGA
ncbi:MAG: WSD1 family O-acyltransferase [Dermatophilaceae bacterium]